jgi:hypothetical protein
VQNDRDGFTYRAVFEISAEGREPRGGGVDVRLAHDLSARCFQ